MHTLIIYKNQQLHLEFHNIFIVWLGKRGLVCEDVKQGFRYVVHQIGYPDALMTHCRGNSIGSIYWRRLQKDTTLTVANIHYAAQLYYFFPISGLYKISRKTFDAFSPLRL